MAAETLLVGLINVIVGFIILTFKASLRIIVGGYFLLTGLLMVLVPLLS